MSTKQSPIERQYVAAVAAVAEIARKQGTPEYDPRAHKAALDRERKVAAEVRSQGS